MKRAIKKLFKSNYLFTAGVIICVFWIAMAILAPLIAPYDPIVQDLSIRLQAPSASHIFGTDNFGRDIFSRVLKGSGTTIFIALSTVAIGAAAGVNSHFACCTSFGISTSTGPGLPDFAMR